MYLYMHLTLLKKHSSTFDIYQYILNSANLLHKWGLGHSQSHRTVNLKKVNILPCSFLIWWRSSGISPPGKKWDTPIFQPLLGYLIVWSKSNTANFDFMFVYSVMSLFWYSWMKWMWLYVVIHFYTYLIIGLCERMRYSKNW